MKLGFANAQATEEAGSGGSVGAELRDRVHFRCQPTLCHSGSEESRTGWVLQK